jgi:membrane protease YdiL (CAAX protease family)
MSDNFENDPLRPTGPLPPLDAVPADEPLLPTGLPPLDAVPAEDAALPPPQGRVMLNTFLGLLAWVVIVVLVCLTVLSRHPLPTAPAANKAAEVRPEPGDAANVGDQRPVGRPPVAEPLPPVPPGLPPVVRAAPPTDEVGPLLMLLQGRYLVGASSMLGEKDRQQLYEGMKKSLNTGSLDQRLRFVVLAGDLAGPDEALTQLDELDQLLAKDQLKPAPHQRGVMDALQTLYESYRQGQWDAPKLDADDRQLLKDELGWFGDLALAPREGDKTARAAVEAPALRMLTAVVAALVWVVFFLGAGCLGLLALGGLWLAGVVRGRLQCPTGHGGVYAETFALWMGMFVGLLILVGSLNVGEYHYLMLLAAELLSLLALLWPVLRGVPWQQVRADIGWTLGPRPLLEPFLGIAAYAMTLPLLACGVGVMLVLILLGFAGKFPGLADAANDFDPMKFQAHPIFEWIAHGSFWDRVQLVVLASVVAPLVEETMFRGVLHRHLRDLSCGAGAVVSVLFSGLVVSTIFAVIHPQALVAVPVLMAMAFGFTIAREWRGSVLPGMVAHGLSNGAVITLMMYALGS